MNIQQKIQEKIVLLTQEKNKTDLELQKLEQEFADIKLNPYGITSIDFSRRQELSSDALKMEGSLMGLQLALEIITESPENA
jgi:hypothetical protein